MLGNYLQQSTSTDSIFREEAYNYAQSTRLPNDLMLNIWLNIEKQFFQEENKKLENVIQQPMHSYICGINLKSESCLVLSAFLFV